VKPGDLIMCTWQPRCRGVVDTHTLPMERTIKGEVGIIINVHDDKVAVDIMFLHLGCYIHPLAPSAFEVISESR
jgi:hypothetical protein